VSQQSAIILSKLYLGMDSMTSNHAVTKSFPSSSSAFKPYVSKKIKSDTSTPPIKMPPVMQKEKKIDDILKKNNPYGFSWRGYTESEMRKTLKRDIILKNFIVCSINRHKEELLELSKMSKLPGRNVYEHYIFLKDSLDKMVQKLKLIEEKLTLHADYMLYCGN
jgi:hypothetical protein